MAVVCAGPKAILDVPATLEYLETRGVPVVTIGQDELPGFYARSSRDPRRRRRRRRRRRGADRRRPLGLGLGGMLVCVPVPEAEALPGDVARDAVERAVREADDAGIAGPALTPWLLARIAEITDGASVRANTALIVNNARGRRAARRSLLGFCLARCSGASFREPRRRISGSCTHGRPREFCQTLVSESYD